MTFVGGPLRILRGCSEGSEDFWQEQRVGYTDVSWRLTCRPDESGKRCPDWALRVIGHRGAMATERALAVIAEHLDDSAKRPSARREQIRRRRSRRDA